MNTMAPASALIVRTAGRRTPPYLQRPCARGLPHAPGGGLLVERGIATLVLDLPSADRADDGGKLTAHRIFFGLPPGSRRASEAQRPRASITELASIAPSIADGLYVLDLQLPAFLSDAAPATLLYAVQPE